MALQRSEEKIAAPQKMTWEKFLEWMDEDIWAEWVNGEVIVMSACILPTPKVSLVFGSIDAALGRGP